MTDDTSKNSKKNKQHADSKLIDDQLKIEAQIMSRELKILLLGAGQTGKSTFFKQLKIIQDNDYTLSERLNFKSLILSNTIESLMTILNAMKVLGIQFANMQSNSDSQKVFALAFTVDLTERFSSELTNAMKNLWHDSDLQSCFSRSNEYQLNDTAK